MRPPPDRAANDPIPASTASGDRDADHPVRRLPMWESRTPELSLVMPCYNEEAALGDTGRALVEAFRNAGVDLELVLVDNGSTDRTGHIIDEFMEQGLPVTKVAIAKNRGYSYGIRQGLAACRAPILGYLCADGQITARDVVHTYDLARHRPDEVLAKVRRRLRKDSWRRKLVSVIYNGLMYVAFGWLGSIDLNASPKIFSRGTHRRLRLASDDWFLDPEIMLKVRDLGLQVIELNVEGRSRHAGQSHVRPQAMLEFLRNIARYRFRHELERWGREVGIAPGIPAPSTEPPTAGGLNRVRIVDQRRAVDQRGFVHKVLMASQCEGSPPAGEVYVTGAEPGQSKGHHYHRRMGEWFTVVQGEATLRLVDPITGERRAIALSVSTPSSVYVPAGLAHALFNTGPGLLMCVAWAEREYDPGDVVPYPIEADSAER